MSSKNIQSLARAAAKEADLTWRHMFDPTEYRDAVADAVAVAVLTEQLEALERQPHIAPCLQYHGKIEAACICWMAPAIKIVRVRLAQFSPSHEGSKK